MYNSHLSLNNKTIRSA